MIRSAWRRWQSRGWRYGAWHRICATSPCAAGTVLRNRVLFALEAHAARVPPLWHDGIGLAVLALVCVLVAGWVRGGSDACR